MLYYDCNNIAFREVFLQVKNEKVIPLVFPEYYLFKTYDQESFLQNRLTTLDGQPLRFIRKGIPNLDNGPDYLQALIQVGDVQMQGDIEFHRDWQDWYRHGHDRDRRYNQVVLHILWTKPHKIPAALTDRFPHFVLSRHLRLSVELWQQRMKEMDRENLSGNQTIPPAQLSCREIETYAWERFRRKCHEVKQWVEEFDWDTAVYIGLARSLGYSKNSDPFTALVKSLPPKCLVSAVHPLQRSPLIFWILLAWQAGLLDRPLRLKAGHPPGGFYRQVYHLKKQFSHLCATRRQPLTAWNFSRLRPVNNPYVRLAGFARILFTYQEKLLFGELLQQFSQRYFLSRLLPEVEARLCIPLGSEFRAVFTRLLGLSSLPGTSMGRGRCRQFILNIILPLFYVWSHINHCPGFLQYLEDLYFEFPAVDDNVWLREQSNRNPAGRINRAYIQQGLLEYHYQKFSPGNLTKGKSN